MAGPWTGLRMSSQCTTGPADSLRRELQRPAVGPAVCAGGRSPPLQGCSMRPIRMLCLAVLLLPPTASAQAQSVPPLVVQTPAALESNPEPDTGPEIVDHQTVVVSGALPGPGLWKVRKDGNTLYVLATLSPLPKRMEWESAGV